MSGGHSGKARHRAAMAAMLLLAACQDATPARAPDRPRPELFLITALPIVWGEDFGLDQAGSPALHALEREYTVKPVDLPSQLPEGALLLAAQPRALPAEELVALDAWVRRGGRLVLLADPVLDWPSDLPLGDPRRAPISFADTGLLQHWGLRLDAPEERGPRALQWGDDEILTSSPGELHGKCEISSDRALASCQIDKGMVRIVADADFLNVGKMGSEGPAGRNLAALLSQLAAVTR